jgi:8-oxo-(d)GTP phosphatase
VALIRRPRYDDWSFPKGKLEPGEHVLTAAVREVAEETGVWPVLGRRLRPANYLSHGRPKHVDYWVGHPAGTPAPFAPNAEVDELAWLPLTAARDRLSYPHDVNLIDEFAAGPTSTTAFILVRHTSARDRRAWQRSGHPDDLARPLTAWGRAQAERLGGVLACFGAARVVSSGARRCLDTVQPYARLTGAAVEAEPAFTLAGGGAQGGGAQGGGAQGGAAQGGAAQGGAAQSEAAQSEAVRKDGARKDGGRAAVTQAATAEVRQRIGELLAGRQPVVICAHRENLPSLLSAACEWLGAPLLRGRPLAKGGFWALHTDDGQLCAAERHGTGS